MGLIDLLEEPLPEKKPGTVKRVLAVIDAETDPFQRVPERFPQPFLWGFYDGDTYEEFVSAVDMLAYFEQYPKPLLVYAHNGGKFDYHFLLEFLEPETQVMIINGRLSKFKIGNCEFRDSYNLFNFPLAAYQKDEIDYALMEPGVRDLPENKKKISDYLYKDCLYLYELVSGFRESYGVSLTQAGAAMKIWQEMSGIKAPRSDGGYYDIFSQYYYGGRVQCFHKGVIEKPFKMIDIVSAYPYAMMFRHPLSLTYDTYKNEQATEYIDSLKDGILSSELSSAFFTVMARSKGALPINDCGTGKLEYPDDGVLRIYRVTGWEIQAGIRTGTLFDISIMLLIVHHETIDFCEYVNRFFELKAIAKSTGNKMDELFAKLFLNSLYGKWAACPTSYKQYTIIEPDSINIYKERGHDESGFLGMWALMEKGIDEERYKFYNVATAASITGFVRAFLWEACCKCEGLLYCDTDSIAAYDVSGISLSSYLGGWELDGEFTSGGIAGRKHYVFKNSETGKVKKACKGARLEADESMRVVMGETVTYKPISPSYSVHKPPRFIDRKIRRI